MTSVQNQISSFHCKAGAWIHAIAIFVIAPGFTLLCGPFPSTASAQTSVTGAINGTVVDSTGAAVAGAVVTMKDEATGATTHFTTNGEGHFTASYLKPDKFDISASSPGLQSVTTTVQVLTAQETGVKVTLTPSASTQTVEVSGNEAQLIDTQTANLVTTFTTQQFQNLPAPGGDITTIAYTIPGVVVGAGTAGFGAIVSDGLPGLSNLVVVNGADYAVPLYGGINYSGSSNLTIGQQEIAQASVVQNGYSTQYGRQAGIIESYTTKAGANRLHGLAQYDYNSAGLNANDFFTKMAGNGRPKAVSNQYAAQIGGPIKHDKLFFFLDTEGIRFIQPNSGFVNLPSPALQASVLANPNLSADSVALYKAMFAGANASPAFAKAIPVVTGPGTLQDSTGSYGCGLGPSQPGGSPGGLGGSPDYATGGTLGTSPAESCINSAFVNRGGLNREWYAAGRLDWNLSDKHRIFFRVTDDQGFQSSFLSLINPAYDQVSNQPSYAGQMNDTYTFTPNLTNNFVLAALYYSGIFKPASIPAGLAASPTEFDQANSGGTNATPGVGQPTFFTESTTLGTPWVDFPAGVNATQYQFTDGLAWLKGNHNFKFGVDFRRNLTTDVSLLINSYGGDYVFASIADEFAGSLPGPDASSVFFQTIPNLGNIHTATYNLGVYAQDEWRATPTLIVDYGVRVDRSANTICHDHCFTRYLGGFPDTSATLNSPYDVTLSAGHDSVFPGIEKAVVQPRAGFNWDARGNGKTVVRGGVGLFSDGAPGLIVEQQFRSFPNSFSAFVPSGNIGTGRGSAAAFEAASGAAVLSGFSQGATFNSLTAQLAALGVPFSAPNYSTSPQTFHSPRYLEYSMQVQQAISPSNAVVVSYAGNHGYDLFIPNTHVNQTIAGTAYAALGFGGLPAAQPDPRFGQVTTFSNDAISNYSGVSIQYKHADRRGLNTNISYTYSHSLDDISNGGNSQLPYNNGTAGISVSQITPGLPSKLGYSSSDYDIRNNFVMDLTYVEPYRFGNQFVNVAAAGWTLGTKAYWRSGEPFSVVNSHAGAAVSANGTGVSAVLADVLNNHFNHSCNSFSSRCLQTPGIFNGAGPQDAGPGVVVQDDFGNVPRNSFRGPHYSDVDVNLYKDLFKKENFAFQVGAQAYNVLNHVNFASPAATGGNNASNPSSLGQISTDISPPTSPYGAPQQPIVAGRVLVVQGRLLF